ncbi:TIGR00341 family protein [Sphingorhabdus sp. SMR4y]|uniref:TIGR00341 family protein n=1 Tax=Sphingorhabdus sp. SMR4y TaxID=2584094 RepID=UPI000B5CF4D3|nr:TIGR00341 family protein [Sphingorhabdus sp. SMR4y]ASK87693.1 TIGR00341 family protein [Sphingorhabdus sp. SMR4y]
MSARLVEIIVPDAGVAQAKALIAEHCSRFWQEPVPDGLEKFSCVVPSRSIERLLAALDENFSGSAGFSVLVLQVEAVLPEIPELQEIALPASGHRKPPTKLEAFFTRDRISTNELYDDIEPSLELRPNYLLTVILSALIAALGMRSGQTAVVIGAMIIAPLLGPTMAMAMAATVGDRLLGRRAMITLVTGILAALIFTFLLGLFIEIDPLVPELRNRTIVHPADIALALACGAAGVLAFSQGASLSLVGVMIAVALVPPIAAAGLFFGSGNVNLGISALFLLATNLVCINVSGIATFLVQGLPPRSWRLTSGIFVIWLLILVLFIGLVGGRIALGADGAIHGPSNGLESSSLG